MCVCNVMFQIGSVFKETLPRSAAVWDENLGVDELV